MADDAETIDWLNVFRLEAALHEARNHLHAMSLQVAVAKAKGIADPAAFLATIGNGLKQTAAFLTQIPGADAAADPDGDCPLSVAISWLEEKTHVEGATDSQERPNVVLRGKPRAIKALLDWLIRDAVGTGSHRPASQCRFDGNHFEVRLARPVVPKMTGTVPALDWLVARRLARHMKGSLDRSGENESETILRLQIWDG